MELELELISGEFTVCKISDISGVDFNQKYLFLSITEDEISLVCGSDNVPGNAVALDAGWAALKVAGQLDFSLVGVLSKISAALSEKGISIFAVSTYNTDYILLKKHRLADGIGALKQCGCSVKKL